MTITKPTRRQSGRPEPLPTRPAGLPPGANGELPLELRLGWLRASATLTGGPYRACPETMSGVCLLEAGPKTQGMGSGQACAVHLPIEDFNVPDDPAALDRALKRTLRLMVAGEAVYVGCAGGWGRTGLFLSLLAKVAGEPDPVAYVRKHYVARAVETSGQRQFVDQFETAALRRWLLWPLLWHRLRAFVGR